MKISIECPVGWKHVILKVADLELAGNPYIDSEQVWRSPILLRVRLKLALNRILRRNAKLVAFYKRNAC